MNPVAVFAIIVALIVGYFAFSGGEFSLFGGGNGTGPVATGPGRGSEIQNPQPVSRGFFEREPGRPSPTPHPKPGESPYKGKVKISSIERSSSQPGQEYAVLRFSGGFFFGAGESREDRPIDVSGWTIGSLRSIESIPRALNIPEIDAAEQDIFLPPGGELIIVTGTPSYQQNFRENRCVGYFNQSHSFTPSLSDSCADDNPDRSSLLAQGFNGACIDAIQSVPACRTPQGPFFPSLIKSECIDYLNRNFNYVGCVKNFRDTKDFLKSTWRVSLRRNQKLYDPKHDRIILRDRNGLLVDEFEY